jgi:ABC-type transport system involved in multi-copper enzyme maturation permease subunit
MLRRIRAVALNTYRETVRDRIFYLVGLFGVVLVASSVVLSPLSIGAQEKIVVDVGLGALTLFGLLVTVLVGSNMVRKEQEKRTATTILAKPVSRREYLLGKFLGLNLTLLAMLAVMATLFVGTVLITPATFSVSFLAAFYLAYLELLLVTAAVVLFSTAVSPPLAAVLTLTLFVIGHLSESLRSFGALLGSPLQARLTDLVYYVVPNLEMFNVRGAVVHGDPVTAEHLALATLYGVAYAALLLIVAGSVFARKELR